MVAVETIGDVGEFGRSLADVLNVEKLEGAYKVEIRKVDVSDSGQLAQCGPIPQDSDAILAMIRKPVNAEATLHFVKLISQEFCRWMIEKEHVRVKRRALVIREEGAERKLRTILFDDVGA
jgi:hypothetical protein